MKNMIAAITVTTLALFSTLAFAHDGHEHPDKHLVFKNGIHAHLFWEAGPQEGLESVLRVEFKNAADHSALDIKSTPELSLWMPSMGHGSSPTKMEKIIDAQGNVVVGSYRFSKVYFVMSGDWDVNLTLKSADGTKETQTFPIPVGTGDGAGHHH